jgi:glycosyltransferase involved in cell wall biosynthesis
MLKQIWSKRQNFFCQIRFSKKVGTLKTFFLVQPDAIDEFVLSITYYKTIISQDARRFPSLLIVCRFYEIKVHTRNFTLFFSGKFFKELYSVDPIFQDCHILSCLKIFWIFLNFKFLAGPQSPTKSQKYGFWELWLP